MIDKDKLVQISLPAPNITRKFDLATVAGRDDIADQIKEDIDEYCRQAYSDGPRSHLGASVVGNKCERYIWFQFRWMNEEVMSGRMQRLVNRGHLEEDRIIGYLRGIGMNVISADDNGKQIRIIDVQDHFGGSCDGKAILPERYQINPTKLLLEMKTANDRIFKLIYGQGVVKQKPQHWIQMCLYGYKLNIKHALYICASKNDDDLDVEVLEIDWELAKKEIEKAERIIFAIIPPPRISENPSWFECKFCSAQAICHFKAPVNKNCRSCQYSKPTSNATWTCNVYQQVIPLDFIKKGCEQWQPINH